MTDVVSTLMHTHSLARQWVCEILRGSHFFLNFLLASSAKETLSVHRRPWMSQNISNPFHSHRSSCFIMFHHVSESGNCRVNDYSGCNNVLVQYAKKTKKNPSTSFHGPSWHSRCLATNIAQVWPWTNCIAGPRKSISSHRPHVDTTIYDATLGKWNWGIPPISCADALTPKKHADFQEVDASERHSPQTLNFLGSEPNGFGPVTWQTAFHLSMTADQPIPEESHAAFCRLQSPCCRIALTAPSATKSGRMSGSPTSHENWSKEKHIIRTYKKDSIERPSKCWTVWNQGQDEFNKKNRLPPQPTWAHLAAAPNDADQPLECWGPWTRHQGLNQFFFCFSFAKKMIRVKYRLLKYIQI